LPGSGRLSRRALLLGAAATLQGQKAETTAFDLSLLDDPAVPNELFFVREHFPQPAALSSAGFKIAVGAASVSFDDLVALPRRILPVTIECAENPVGGGLVSHAEWTGCSLSAVLPKTEARFVRLTGADGFSHTIPIAKALHPDTLLATNMNGEKLPTQHGFPVRAIIPGWYGTGSVKWLQRIELLASEPAAAGYVRQTRSLLAGVSEEGAVMEGGVKSVFSRPMDGAILSKRGRFVVRGAAWAGEQRVRTVEVSVDGAKTWQPARLEPNPPPYSWVRWSWDWKIAAAGEFELSVRATDDKARTQPQERASNRIDNYEWDAWQTIKVVVT
jgi:DMSO/TMAO reductase YedYZ molybdopterin-dependent catalytic subunit